MKATEADLAFTIEALRMRTTAMIGGIEQEILALRHEKMIQEAPKVDTYVQNLEALVKELTQENAELFAKVRLSKVPDKKKILWGVKKDGTPKKKPGRSRGI